MSIYTPLKVKSFPRSGYRTSMMPKKGMNREDLSQLMSMDYALSIVNYIPYGYGLEIRKGLEKIFERAGSAYAVTLLKEWFDGLWIFGYGTKIESYDMNTGVFTTIKSNFSMNDGFDGTSYGDYFLTCNGVEKIHRIYQQISVSVQTTKTIIVSLTTGSISIGDILTNTTNSVTGTVVSAGYLTATTMVVTINGFTGSWVSGNNLSGGSLVGASINKVQLLTVGQKITGQTSGATAMVLEITGNDSSGTVVLGDINGTPQNGEIFTDKNGEQVISTSAVSFQIAEIVDSPVCGGLKSIGPRIYAFRLSTDSTSVKFSAVDDGTNPPFTNWTETTASDTAGHVNYRNAGPVRSVVQLGQFTVVFSDKGFYAFYISTITDQADGTLKKTEIIQNYTEDYGGARGAIETPLGVFYLNEAGLWQMVAVGATYTPMSQQQILTSTLLGSAYFKNVNQSEVDLIHDVNQKCIFVTCAKDSASNNLVIGYKLDLKAFFEFKNWNISRFAKSGNDIYGASSIKTTVYKLFEGYDDDGLDIGTEYYQEIPLNTLFNLHSLNGIYAGGFLSPSSELRIRFDTYSRTGQIIYDKEIYKWTVSETEGAQDYDEWGSAKWGDSSIGGGMDTAGLVESFGGGSPRVNNMQRLRIRITGSGQLRHILSWISAKTQQKGEAKRRNFTRIT